MFTRRTRLLSAAVLAVAVGAVTLSPGTSRSQKGEVKPDIGKKVAPAAERTLAPDDLPAFLENLGYEPEVSRSEGNVWCYLVVPRGSWKFHATVTLSIDRQIVWILAPLSPLPEPAKVTAPAFLKLLEANAKTAPAFFAYTDKRLYLERAVDNRGMTASRFRLAFDQLLASVTDTVDAWDTSKWTAGGTAGAGTGGAGGQTAAKDAPEALRQIFTDLLATSRAGGKEKVAAAVSDMLLPDPNAWFRAKFADPAKAELVAFEYKHGTPGLVSWVAGAVEEAAREASVEVRVSRFTTGQEAGALPAQKQALVAMKQPAPLYSVWLAGPGGDAGTPLWSFAFVDGRFRVLGKMRALSADAAPPGANQPAAAQATGKPTAFAPSDLPLEPLPADLQIAEPARVNDLTPLARELRSALQPGNRALVPALDLRAFADRPEPVSDRVHHQKATARVNQPEFFRGKGPHFSAPMMPVFPPDGRLLQPEPLAPDGATPVQTPESGR